MATASSKDIVIARAIAEVVTERAVSIDIIVIPCIRYKLFPPKMQLYEKPFQCSLSSLQLVFEDMIVFNIMNAFQVLFVFLNSNRLVFLYKADFAFKNK